MPWYTIMTLAAMAVVVALELLVVRSGIFRSAAYWIAIGICFLFQIPVDGWLTKLSSPIVIYNSEVFSDIRIFWSSPIEDWGFGFALMTLALALWVRLGRNESPGTATTSSAPERESARA
ncbi:MAG: lycopene cyclase domain-containing protein [Microthrixaceae bacterium]